MPRSKVKPEVIREHYQNLETFLHDPNMVILRDNGAIKADILYNRFLDTYNLTSKIMSKNRLFPKLMAEFSSKNVEYAIEAVRREEGVYYVGIEDAQQQNIPYTRLWLESGRTYRKIWILYLTKKGIFTIR